MEWLVYTVLGLVQGITEWLPISSSGHLVIIEEIFGVQIPGLAFEVLLNFATFLAMIVVFRKELMKLITGFFRFILMKKKKDKDDFYFGLYLLVGVIPAGVLGLVFEDTIEYHLKTLTTVAISLIITGIAIYIISKIDGYRKELKLTDAIWVGFFQAIALIPGISRAGATIFASLYRRLDKELAIRYSFFLAIPISLGTMVLKVDDLLEQFTLNMFMNYSLAFFVSFISAIFAIKWFIGILNKGKLIYFTYYCITVGTGILVYQFIRWI